MSAPEPVLPRIRPEIAALPPYRQGKAAGAGGFKVSSNENPFPPLPGVVEAVQAAGELNRYPDATAARLRERLGERYGVSADAVIVGAGSVSLLAAFIQAAAGAGDEVVYAWRSFEAYPGLVLVAGAENVQVPLLPDGRHDLDAMAAAVTERTRVILLCTPNNPTGPVITSEEFHAFLARVPADVLVLLDEAYVEFASGAVDGLRERVFEAHPNVVVLRTFSKAYGLAALRVGYGIGHPRVLDAARSTAIPLSVTAHAEVAALASLDHAPELAERVAEIAAQRDTLAAALRELGWRVPDAQGNFVWLDGAGQTTADAFEEAGIIVRPFPEGIRISVGEPEAIARILEVAAAVASPA
ncbi:histidinol-phosphate transaminase [Microbacterium oryzae]|uniref:histidinol-phosphate transaminase n=1 Tax=Microbacterium oryzae TaxID=743009 RepID=UPI0025AFD7BA|nr:histidinol-phosphate transaminase [Microbacterium oryzae]MDN3311335.1 histidinol-phosphate transaminase [Microbacterium oryzae]